MRVTTERKRAELTAAGEPWPSCSCHDAPLNWNTDPRRSGGGRFVCRVEYQAQRKARRESERRVQLEPGFSEETVAALERNGYETRVWPEWHHFFGGVSLVTPTDAAGDPRRSGGAARVP